MLVCTAMPSALVPESEPRPYVLQCKHSGNGTTPPSPGVRADEIGYSRCFQFKPVFAIQAHKAFAGPVTASLLSPKLIRNSLLTRLLPEGEKCKFQPVESLLIEYN